MSYLLKNSLFDIELKKQLALSICEKGAEKGSYDDFLILDKNNVDLVMEKEGGILLKNAISNKLDEKSIDFLENKYIEKINEQIPLLQSLSQRHAMEITLEEILKSPLRNETKIKFLEEMITHKEGKSNSLTLFGQSTGISNSYERVKMAIEDLRVPTSQIKKMT